MTLKEAARAFFGLTTPKIMLPGLVGLVAWRLSLGPLTPADAIPIVVIVAIEPFAEWLIHVHYLHLRPRRIAGITFDPNTSRKHREHHERPDRYELIGVPLPNLLVTFPLVFVAYWFLIEAPVSVTTMATTLAALTAYEWTHFLIHTPYRPSSRAYRYVWRAHRLHHYRNERYWFGVTNHLADHLLGTFPAKSEVPVSPTARTLGVEQTS